MHCNQHQSSWFFICFCFFERSVGRSQPPGNDVDVWLLWSQEAKNVILSRAVDLLLLKSINKYIHKSHKFSFWVIYVLIFFSEFLRWPNLKWSQCGYQVVIQWSSNSRCTTYHWCELSNEKVLPVSPICSGPCTKEKQRLPGCGSARKDADHPHLHTYPWCLFPSYGNDGPHIPCNRDNLPPPCRNCRRNCHTWHVFEGWKVYQAFTVHQALSEIQKTTHLDTFCFAACFLS